MLCNAIRATLLEVQQQVEARTDGYSGPGHGLDYYKNHNGPWPHVGCCVLSTITVATSVSRHRHLRPTFHVSLNRTRFCFRARSSWTQSGVKRMEHGGAGWEIVTVSMNLLSWRGKHNTKTDMLTAGSKGKVHAVRAMLRV